MYSVGVSQPPWRSPLREHMHRGMLSGRMSLSKHKTTGKVLSTNTIRRRQKRKPRRLLEAVPLDWGRWDAAADTLGLNWSEFARRAQNALADKTLSEKPAAKNGAARAAKARRPGAREKDSSRT